MEEQVKYLRSKNITSFFIISSFSQDRISEVISTLTPNTDTRYALLFTSPEWLQSPQIKNMLNSLKAQERFKLIVIDEAHCVDLWGGFFRASYSNLAFLKEFQVPILALSGSATDHTVSVIHQSLKMDCPIVSRMSFLRTNLDISVIKKSCKPVKQIVDLIALRNPEQCGMVYCNKRKTTVDLAHTLRTRGISATFIHGGLDDTERGRNEQPWKSGQVLVACCTKSFSMGTDKSDVRFVHHIDLPESVEDCYQEIGRAGRDREPAFCSALFSLDDRSFHLQSILLTSDEHKDEKQHKLKNVNEISKLFMQQNTCRHASIMEYFSETVASCEDECDVCINSRAAVPSDCYSDASVVMECFTDIRKLCNKVTPQLLQLTLLGSKAQDIKLKGLDRVKHFGKANADYKGNKRDTKCYVQNLIFILIYRGYLEEVIKQKANPISNANRTQISEIFLEHGNLTAFGNLEQLMLP